MEGARRGGVVFQCLCAQILGALSPSREGANVPCSGDWAQGVVPAQVEQYRVEHFVDADPADFFVIRVVALTDSTSGSTALAGAGPPRICIW